MHVGVIIPSLESMECVCDLCFKAFPPQIQALEQEREKVFLQLMYLQAQRLLGQPRASGDHSWELDVFPASYPGDVVEVSV